MKEKEIKKAAKKAYSQLITISYFYRLQERYSRAIRYSEEKINARSRSKSWFGLRKPDVIWIKD